MLGMIVAQTLRRNTKITITTRTMVSISVNCTSLTEARIVVVRSDRMRHWMSGGIAASSLTMLCLMLSTVLMTLTPGCLKMTRKTPRLPLPQAGLRRIGGSRDRLADVAHAHRRAVAIGDDDVVPLLRLVN